MIIILNFELALNDTIDRPDFFLTQMICINLKLGELDNVFFDEMVTNLPKAFIDYNVEDPFNALTKMNNPIKAKETLD